MAAFQAVLAVTVSGSRVHEKYTVTHQVPGQQSVVVTVQMYGY